MAFRNKDDTIAEAARLGVDIEGMSWPEMQRAVKQALLKEELGVVEDAPVIPEEKRRMQPYLDKTIRVSPEMAPDANRIIRYPEPIGEDIDIEEKTFAAGGNTQYTAGRDYATGTFRIKGRTGRQVIAESSLPKENAQIVFRPGIDMFPVVTFQGRSGYLLTHNRLPNFKDTLMQAGAYEEYKHMLVDEPNVFYLTGLLCVKPEVAHHIMTEIETKWAKRRKFGEL